MATTRGVRMDEETIARLQRLTWAMRKTQAELMREYISRGYQEALKHEKWGPRLRMAEQDDQQLKPAKKSRPKGVAVRFSPDEAIELRKEAMDRTGDPGMAPELVKTMVREKLLGNGGSDKVG